ncbi:MAG: hypothetical protein CL933_19280 [Deltaproteobacteria bacterium]|nr:hypothetical protein [Deltaproteobacteria bacterium]
MAESSGENADSAERTETPAGRVEKAIWPMLRRGFPGHHRLEGEIVAGKCYYGVMASRAPDIHHARTTRRFSGGATARFLRRAGDRMRVAR